MQIVLQQFFQADRASAILRDDRMVVYVRNKKALSCALRSANSSLNPASRLALCEYHPNLPHQTLHARIVVSIKSVTRRSKPS